MQLIKGTVVQGKVVLEGATLPEGVHVAVFAQGTEEAVHLSPSEQAELDEALAEADKEDGISGDELLEHLRKYG